MRSWPFYFKTEVILGYLFTILRFVVFCSFAYVKKIPQFLLIQLKYKLKGKNRFSGFTGLESDSFSVLILSKTAQAY
jgi:hypothetical protein